MVRSLALSLVSAIALFSAANAADIYRAEGPGGYKDGPIYTANTWTGFYIGVNGGYASSNDDNARGGILPSLSPEGGFGGGQIGYNWQGGFGLGRNIVFGIEADFQGGDIKDGRSFLGLAGYDTNLNWFGTVRGRIGYAFDRTLVYATGGFAYGEVEDSAYVLSLNASKSKTETGYVVGGGIEYKINPAWSLKAEYQYISLDSGSNNLENTIFRNNEDNEFHTVRAGINYHVGQSYEPLK